MDGKLPRGNVEVRGIVAEGRSETIKYKGGGKKFDLIWNVRMFNRVT